MANARGVYADGGKFYWAEDANQDTATFLGNDASIALALLGGGNWLVSGGALGLTSGMSGTIAQTTVFANGVLLTVPAGTFTLANGNTQPRYDVLYVVLGATGGSNPTSGNTTTADSGTFGVQPGTPASNPVKPELTNANYCQIGSIYVPTNATSLTTGNLNSQDVSPNSNGPLPAFSGVQSHIGMNMSIATTHGIRTEWGDTPAVTADGSGNHSFIVGFPTAFNNTPTVNPSFTNFIPAAGATITVTNRTPTGCTIAIQGAGPGATVQASWSAFGI